MRKSVSILLVMVALTMIGCASGDAGNSAEPVKANSQKSDAVELERQKAIDWISKNNTWGPEAGFIGEVIKNIDTAIKEKENIWIAFGSGIMKSKKPTEVRWINNRFSVYGFISDKDLDLPELGIRYGGLKEK
jgi:hypothetical protein